MVASIGEELSDLKNGLGASQYETKVSLDRTQPDVPD